MCVYAGSQFNKIFLIWIVAKHMKSNYYNSPIYWYIRILPLKDFRMIVAFGYFYALCLFMDFSFVIS